MDSELEQVICTVLSLEEEYSVLSLMNQDNIIHTSQDLPSAEETQDLIQSSITLQQTLLEIYTLLGIQKEANGSKLVGPKEPATMLPSSMYPRDESPTSHQPLKRKICGDETQVCKKPRVMSEDSQKSPCNHRCRKRTIFTNEQTIFLISQFDCDPYPDFGRRCQIAHITGISEPRIQIWFQNRRARHLLKPCKPQKHLNRKSSSTGGVCDSYSEITHNLQLCGGTQTPQNIWRV